MSKNHSQSAGIHPGAYWQDADPTTTHADAIVAKVIWIDTTDAFYRVKVRNDADTDWILVGYIGAPPFRTLAVAGAMLNTDELVFLDPAVAPFTFDLLPIADRTGSRPVTLINIADPATSANVVTLDPDGAETIGADATLDIAPGDKITIIPRTAAIWERI